jgi:hypothetical protein
MLQYDFTQQTDFEVARTFGQQFAEQLLEVEVNRWQGPIESGYGLHLVRVNEKIDARLPELAAVIDKVRTDWMGKGFPEIGSPNGPVKQNTDGTTDVYFRPKAPKGMASNWIQTVAGRGWFTALRLYNPQKPWFDKTWRPGEIELVN